MRINGLFVYCLSVILYS